MRRLTPLTLALVSCAGAAWLLIATIDVVLLVGERSMQPQINSLTIGAVSSFGVLAAVLAVASYLLRSAGCAHAELCRQLAAVTARLDVIERQLAVAQQADFAAGYRARVETDDETSVRTLSDRNRT